MMLTRIKYFLCIVGLMGSVGAASNHWSEGKAGRLLRDLADPRRRSLGGISLEKEVTERGLIALKASALQQLLASPTGDYERHNVAPAVRVRMNQLLWGLRWLRLADKATAEAKSILMDIQTGFPLFFHYLDLLHYYGTYASDHSMRAAASFLRTDPHSQSIIEAMATGRTTPSLDFDLVAIILQLLRIDAGAFVFAFTTNIPVVPGGGEPAEGILSARPAIVPGLYTDGGICPPGGDGPVIS